MSTKNESAEERPQNSMDIEQSRIEQELPNTKNRMRLSSPNAFVPIIGLSYFAVFSLVLILQSIVTTGSLATYQFFFIPFAIVSIIAAIGIWRRPGLGYIAAILLSAILVIIFFATRDGNDVITVLSNPANTNEFVFYVTNVPTFFAVLFSSILGVREVRRLSNTSIRVGWPRAFSSYKVIALVVLGFILGGLVVGGLAGATETKLLTASGTSDSVTIVLGAGSISNGQFYSPSTLTVKVGATVTWINHDTTAHTVTSMNGAFGSGNMNPGAVYKFTFTSAGNYTYYCVYHSWMKGEIIVTSS